MDRYAAHLSDQQAEAARVVDQLLASNGSLTESGAAGATPQWGVIRETLV